MTGGYCSLSPRGDGNQGTSAVTNIKDVKQPAPALEEKSQVQRVPRMRNKRTRVNYITYRIVWLLTKKTRRHCGTLWPRVQVRRRRCRRRRRRCRGK